MSDDLPISDFADQLHDDLLVKRLTDSDNTGFSNDLEKGASVDEVPKTASGGFFYRLVIRLSHLNVSYVISVPLRLRSALKTRAFTWCWSTSWFGASQRARNSGPPRAPDAAMPWSVSAANTLPPWFGNVESTASKDACVLNPIVAPQSR